MCTCVLQRQFFVELRQVQFEAAGFKGGPSTEAILSDTSNVRRNDIDICLGQSTTFL